MQQPATLRKFTHNGCCNACKRCFVLFFCCKVPPSCLDQSMKPGNITHSSRMLAVFLPSSCTNHHCGSSTGIFTTVCVFKMDLCDCLSLSVPPFLLQSFLSPAAKRRRMAMCLEPRRKPKSWKANI